MIGNLEVWFAFILNGVWSSARFNGDGLLRWGILNADLDFSDCAEVCLLILIGSYVRESPIVARGANMLWGYAYKLCLEALCIFNLSNCKDTVGLKFNIVSVTSDSIGSMYESLRCRFAVGLGLALCFWVPSMWGHYTSAAMCWDVAVEMWLR